MRLGIAAAALMACLAGMALPAQAAGKASYACKNGKSVRKVFVKYAEEDKKVPCEVVYIKNGEGQSIYSANVREGYCEEKAKSFADKLGEMGWPCSEDSGG